jgi:hypothetical protein
MRILITAAAFVTALSLPAFAQTGNIAGTNFPAEPVNSSVKSSARAPGGGQTPGYYASQRHYYAVPHRVVKVKKKKVRRTTVAPGY